MYTTYSKWFRKKKHTRSLRHGHDFFLIIIEFSPESITAKIEQERYREWFEVELSGTISLFSIERVWSKMGLRHFRRPISLSILATLFRAFDAAYCSTPNCSSHSVYFQDDFRGGRFASNILIEFNKRVFIARAIWFRRCHRYWWHIRGWEYRGILSARKAFNINSTWQQVETTQLAA